MIPYSRQWIDEDDIAAVTQVLRSDWITQGAQVAQFEAALAQTTGAKHVIAVSSGTAALHLLCIALKLNGESTGLTSPITFAASANCLRYTQAKVKFGDVDPLTGLLQPQSCPSADVSIPVSLAGQVPQLSAFQKQAPYIIEDAAHSLGATYTVDGNTYKSASCAHSQAAILSFHPVKNICTGEGGAITTNDSALAEKLQLLRSHGIIRPEEGPAWYYDQVDLGYHYRMTDFQAALGSSQLTKLTAFIERRRTLAQHYCQAFSESTFQGKIKCAPFSPQSAYHLFIIHLVDPKKRDILHDYLKEQGIGTQIHYKPVYRHSYYQKLDNYSPQPGTEQFSAGCLSIPLFPKMTDSEQTQVIEKIAQCPLL